jgi:hypothetical protein
MWSEIGAARRKPAAKREEPPTRTASKRGRKRGARIPFKQRISQKVASN